MKRGWDWLTRLLIAAHMAMLLAVLIGPFYTSGGPVPPRVGQINDLGIVPLPAAQYPFVDAHSGYVRRNVTPNVSAAPDPVREKGVVWVNIPSHIYHYPGYRWFGTTQRGKYMQETDALAEGNRAAFNERRPRWFDNP